MPKRKAGLAFQDHLLLGKDLYDIRNRLMDIGVLLHNAYPNYKLKRLPEKTVAVVDKLRGILDAEIAEEQYPTDRSRLSRIYYP